MLPTRQNENSLRSNPRMEPTHESTLLLCPHPYSEWKKTTCQPRCRCENDDLSRGANRGQHCAQLNALWWTIFIFSRRAQTQVSANEGRSAIRPWRGRRRSRSPPKLHHLKMNSSAQRRYMRWWWRRRRLVVEFIQSARGPC